MKLSHLFQSATTWPQLAGQMALVIPAVIGLGWLFGMSNVIVVLVIVGAAVGGALSVRRAAKDTQQ